MNKIKILFALASLLAASGCTNEGYDTGDGSLSYMRADFVEMYCHEPKKVKSAITDNLDTLNFEPYMAVEWAETADSTYRALLYYNKKDGGKTEPLSVSYVPVLIPSKASGNKETHKDPIDFESAWISKNGYYMNIGFALKNGTIDKAGSLGEKLKLIGNAFKKGRMNNDTSIEDKLKKIGVALKSKVKGNSDAKHVIGIICDTIMTRDDNTREYHYRFYHDQNGIPEYYSTRIYASVPLRGMNAGDEILFTVNTYKGEVKKRFRL